MSGSFETSPGLAALFARGRALAEPMGRSPLAADIAALSRRFTTDREDQRAGYMNEGPARRAYLAWFAPLNAARIAGLLERLFAEEHLDPAGLRRVADLGSGPLSGLAGVRLALDGYAAPERAVALDRSRRSLDDGRALLAGLDEELAARAELVAADLRDDPTPLEEGGFDLVVMANVLEELPAGRSGRGRAGGGLARAVVDGALGALAPGGHLLLVEPGTRLHGRGLMELRDALVTERPSAVASPCPPTKGCPLLARDADWCHQDVEPALPEAALALAKRAGVTAGRLALSHLLLRADDAGSPRATVRLVGGLMRGRDKERRYACTDEGLLTLASKGRRLPRAVAGPLRGARLDVDELRSVLREPGRPAKDRPPRGRRPRR